MLSGLLGLPFFQLNVKYFLKVSSVAGKDLSLMGIMLFPLIDWMVIPLA